MSKEYKSCFSCVHIGWCKLRHILDKEKLLSLLNTDCRIAEFCRGYKKEGVSK